MQRRSPSCGTASALNEADDHRDRLRLQRSPFPSRLSPFPARPDTAARRSHRRQQRQHRRDRRRGARRARRPRGGRAGERARAWRARPRAARARATSWPTSTPTAACRCSGSSGSSGGSRDTPALVAVTGPYRFYDWDWTGRALIRAYDCSWRRRRTRSCTTASAIGAILYGGNFAVRRDALERIGGFDRTIEFHGEDTNLGRRLTPLGSIALRTRVLGLDVGAAVPRDGQAAGLRAVRAELLVRDPAPSSRRPRARRREEPDVPGYEPFLLCDFHVHTTWSDGRLSIREVVDLYGQTGRFDVIAITDHILMKRDLLGPRRTAGVARPEAVLGDRGAASTPTWPRSRRKRSAPGGCTTCSSFRAPRSRRTTSAARRTRTSSR